MKYFIFSLLTLHLGCGTGSSDKTNPAPPPSFVQKSGQEAYVDNGQAVTAPNQHDNSFNDLEESPLDDLSQTGSILERHPTWGKYPEGTITLWLEAVIRVQNGDESAWKDIQYLTIPLKSDKNWMKLAGNSYFINQVRDGNPSFRSFINGATPENGYSVSLNNLRVSIENDLDNGSLGRKYFIISSGADRPRPISLKKSDQTGLYYVNEYSSMYVNVQPPVGTEETFH
jgi:hypothetical protein